MPDYVLKALLVLTGLVLITVLLDIVRRPVRRAVRFAANAVMGLTALLITNALFSLMGQNLGLNWVTCGVSAVLGLPGVALLWGLKLLI
jgi:SigmaK-factor processing regulatory protein BofA.